MKWSHCNGWPTQEKWCFFVFLFFKKNDLIVTGDLPKDRMWLTWQKTWLECDLPGKRLGWSSPDRTRLRNLAPSGCRLTWRLLDDGVNLLFSLRFSYWQGSSHSLLVLGSKPILSSSAQWFFLCPQSCWTSLRIFLQQITNMCNALRLDDMHASLPDVKYRPPPLMIHCHRVPLFVIQSLLCFFDVLAHSCASLPLSCKCCAYPGLSATITALAVYQAWPCPQLRCCVIHHEGA